ncbi:phage head-tail connector protein [Clostridioides difficile]|uniref:phage head-tail connector protein n=1 Tax=Clostridioides difficile TaxID=1496 RepID=UPI0003B1A9DA|nr:phage head-tail connector protein [Clostridioides difficile]EII6798261.1 phage head-tail connector protein [Clostridioides difficile]ERM23146.1 phage gp6-like head-tail connector family protein [Clostridioides difficile P41]MBY1074096.1 phage head-tail connector protein [Clostridioides difficile]MCK8765969.1 phage head-tail connector protein [Clostridioides difficile]MCO8714711.1 phage head-tail connector protein [Clostridioides difficile]
MEVERLKKLLGFSREDDSKDTILEFILEDVEEMVKNYCNVPTIPEQLNSTILKMAIDMYKNESLGSEDIALGSISSISEGDTSVSYRSSASEFKESLLKDYKSQLNRYRKIRWK